MKTLRWIPAIILLLAMSGCAAHTASSPSVPPPPSTTPNADWTIKGNFSFDFTNYVPCSATVTKGCISGWTWGYLNGANQLPIATLAEPVPLCSQTILVNCQVPASTPTLFNFQGNSQLAVGQINFYAVTNATALDGSTQTSVPDTTASPSTIPAGTAQNLTITSIN